MTGAEFTFLAAGVLVGALIVATFDATRMWSMHEDTQQLTHELFDSNEQVKHLEGLIYPSYIPALDESLSPTARRSQLYDKYDGLIVPGTEVVRIDGLED